VLIVEDHRQSRDALRGILEYLGFQPLPAVNLSEGIEAIESNPDFLILDLMLPDGSGVELLRHIRNSGCRTKVAVTTGTHDPELMQQVEELRPDVVLIKPLNLTKLVEWLDRP
jgi:DNA-binding response OmpR family regulator